MLGANGILLLHKDKFILLVCKLLQEEKLRMESEITETLKAFKEQLAQAQEMATMLQSQGDFDTENQADREITRMPPEATAKMTALAETLKQSPNLDADEPPTEEEIREYAEYLGMDPDEDKELLYIAEWALTAPLPDSWTAHLDSEGNEFFHNVVTHVSMPCM